MSSGLARRIEQLERDTGRDVRIFVLHGPDGYDIERAKAWLGIRTGADDVVVYIRDLVGDLSNPVLVSSGPIGGPMTAHLEERVSKFEQRPPATPLS